MTDTLASAPIAALVTDRRIRQTMALHKHLQLALGSTIKLERFAGEGSQRLRFRFEGEIQMSLGSISRGVLALSVLFVAVPNGVSAGSFSHSNQTHAEHDGACEMFPANNLRYPVQNRFSSTTGISEEAFQAVNDALQAVYGPIAAASGKEFQIRRLWTDSHVNASAHKENGGRTMVVSMYGGLARHPSMSVEGFMLVACHEAGHHLGGMPMYPSLGMASEGQADYFGALKCMRQVLPHLTGVLTLGPSFADVDSLPAEAKEMCREFHVKHADQNLNGELHCLRTMRAAESLASVLADITNSRRRGTSTPLLPVPQLNTPDAAVVEETIVSAYPSAQCRIDTYAAGAVCVASVNDPLNQQIPNKGGICLEGLGARPACWYNRKEMEVYDPPTPLRLPLAFEMTTSL